MTDNDHHAPPPLTGLLRKTLSTAAGALRNRAELFMVEVEEENQRLLLLIIGGATVLFMGFMTLMLLTATLIFIFPADDRLYAAGGFAILYAAGTGVAFWKVRGLMKREAFSETLGQFKKDKAWLDSFQ
jgi:uncharacterized membrane protein YqjE